MGPFDTKPARPALQKHSGRSLAATTGGVELRSDAGRDRTGNEAGRVMNWILSFGHSRRVDRELAQEVESHLEEKVAELMEAGMPEREARQQAHREFGNVTLYREISREVWGWNWLETLLQDLKYGV